MTAIDVRDLVGRPGASRVASIQGTVEGLGTELATVPEDAPVAGELLLESVLEGVLASGSLTGTMRLRCARCLTEFDRAFSVEVSELFAAEPDETDEYALDPEGLLPVDQMVRDAVGVELPFSPLCRQDCRGFCSVCGGNRNLWECPGHEEIDPRWAGLERLLEHPRRN
jgi:uncharacterized protein